MGNPRAMIGATLLFAVGAMVGCGGTTGQGGATGGTTGQGGATGGATSQGGVMATGGVVASGGVTSAGGRSGTGGASQSPRQDAAVSADAGASACDRTDLVWKTASKTEYTSYPAPGSPECIQYSGCDYLGMFAACSNTATEAWVSAHNIVAAFPDFNTLKLHDLCLKSGNKTIVVTVIDTCGDSDCGGCCTQNKGTADELIDIESYTAARFGVPDGRIQWADLGPTHGQACP